MHPQTSDYITLRIAHLADPQLGFGPGGFDDDLAAFTTEIKNVNSLRPDLVVIAGDMVNRMDSTSVARFKEAAATIEAPVVYTPGNHDISEPCSPRGLKKYRDAFGPDFSVHRLAGGRTLISFNSLLLRGGPADERKNVAATLRRALNEAHGEGSAVILLCHVPPLPKMWTRTTPTTTSPRPYDAPCSNVRPTPEHSCGCAAIHIKHTAMTSKALRC